MPGAYLWAWDETIPDWIKVEVDNEGRLRTVAEIDHLNDIGDVNVPAPADDDLLYWDETAGEWKDIAHLGVADAHHAEDHKNRHDPNDGADKLDTAIAVKVGEANAVGTSHSLARADHVHEKHHAKYLNAEAVSAVEAAGLALASGKNIKVIQALTADHTWSGLTAVMTAEEALTIGQAVFVGGVSQMELALATGTATMPAMALATASIAENAEGEFLLQGFFRDDTWDWTPGGLLYVSRAAAGALTQTLPAVAGEQVQVVGVAISADIIYFNPSFELVEIS